MKELTDAEVTVTDRVREPATKTRRGFLKSLALLTTVPIAHKLAKVCLNYEEKMADQVIEQRRAEWGGTIDSRFFNDHFDLIYKRIRRLEEKSL